ncbi:hypothetical protein BUALT_Bualt01G0142200 [Buddleja alternifolia]|uniref:Acyl-CoA-binding domain-containing protein n=1 Tax=Buddleja alternifolia TaxID=168488 RepID=A0AAV6YET9_9LAMI|nr:hypothetical protein BUALT_Bualt01G0142200 [Buddleja alternifolia]
MILQELQSVRGQLAAEQSRCFKLEVDVAELRQKLQTMDTLQKELQILQRQKAAASEQAALNAKQRQSSGGVWGWLAGTPTPTPTQKPPPQPPPVNVATNRNPSPTPQPLLPPLFQKPKLSPPDPPSTVTQRRPAASSHITQPPSVQSRSPASSHSPSPSTVVAANCPKPPFIPRRKALLTFYLSVVHAQLLLYPFTADADHHEGAARFKFSRKRTAVLVGPSDKGTTSVWRLGAWTTSGKDGFGRRTFGCEALRGMVLVLDMEAS